MIMFTFSAIFERLRSVLHEGDIDKRVQYMIEVLFATRKDGFKVYATYSIEFKLALCGKYNVI